MSAESAEVLPAVCLCIGVNVTEDCNHAFCDLTDCMVAANNLQCCSCHREQRTSEDYPFISSLSPWWYFSVFLFYHKEVHKRCRETLARHYSGSLSLHFIVCTIYNLETRLSCHRLLVHVLTPCMLHWTHYMIVQDVWGVASNVGVSLLPKFQGKWPFYFDIAQARCVVYSYTGRNSYNSLPTFLPCIFQ